MPDKTLGAYQRHETPDCTAEQGDYVCTRETGHPGPHIAATRVLNHAVGAVWDERDQDDARALLAEAQEEATRQATRADQAELDRDNARRWLRETEALLDQAGHERDEARAERDHFHEVAATFRDKFNAAESHPLTPDAITDEMVERARKRGSELVGALWDPEVVEAMLTAALTPEPERPDGAEEIEAVLREEWTFSDEDGGGDAFGDLAQRLASRGVRVVGEEDR